MRRDLAITALERATGSLRVGIAGGDEASRGTLVILPGRAEFIEKYAETIDDFCDLGFAVAVIEWRGQGLSMRGELHPQRGFVADYDDYLEDLGAGLDHLQTVAAPRPWSMLGHSMGGQIGLRWLHGTADSFVAAVMTAPMFGIPLASVPEPAARFLGRTVVRLGAGRRYAPGQRDFLIERCLYDGNPLTSCPVRFQSYRDLLVGRPELTLGGATWGWLDASLRSIALTRAPGYLESIATPILLCMADAERVVSNPSIELFARRLPQATLRVFAGARHELLLERDEIRSEVLATIDAFLAAVRPPLLAAAPPPA
jgi:lysophospholipase